jgi:hypothetical protein
MKYLKNYNTFILERLDFSGKKLTTLVGLDIQEYTEDSFDCGENKLTSLEGSPKEVGGYFDCRNNLLNTLEGGPIKVGGQFNCHSNKLTSLKYSPKYASCMDCSNNKLTTLEYLSDGIGNGTGDELWCFDNDWIKPIPYKIMKKYNLHLLETDITDYNFVYTQLQVDKFSSFEFQKDFLEREPENFMDLKPFGYAKGLEELFPHLFDMDELGLLD